jgi:hypothetical protein
LEPKIFKSTEKQHHIGFGEVGTSVGVVLFFAVGVAIGSAMGLAGGAISVVGWVISGLFGLVLFFYPSIHANDVSERIPEVKALKASDKRLKNTTISHQYFWIIFIVNLLFGATGIAWLVLFFWAHMPGNVTIPDEILEALGDASGEDAPSEDEAVLSGEAGLTEAGQSTELERKLLEVQQLFERGVITESEATLRRESLLKNV